MSAQLRWVLIIGLPLWIVVGILVGAMQHSAVDGGFSTVLGLCVMALFLSVFNQPGEAKLSPQRAAAIAAGHADRKTIFENTLLKPVMWLLLSLAYSLNVPRGKGWIRQKLTAGGNPDYYTPDEYLALSLLTGLGLGVVMELFGLLTSGRFSGILLFVGLFLGMAGTLYQLHERASKRLWAIAKRVPYALDLISLAMGAGATFTEAARTIVREQPEDPFNVELKTMLAEMELGTTRRQALKNLSDRIPLEMLQNIVASVVQAEELGTPLGQVLHDQAMLLRQQRSVRAENKAAVASVRILVPCLLLVMAVILAIFGPAIVRVVNEGLF